MTLTQKLITAVLVALASVTTEAIWRPASEYLIDKLYVDYFGSEWTGLYTEPVPSSGMRAVGTEDVSKLPHHREEDAWKIKFTGKNLVRARFTEKSVYVFESSGQKGDSWLMLTFRGPDTGRGVIYLEKKQTDYYTGFAELCDCDSPRPASVMICPYVLFKTSDTGVRRLAEADPILKQQCISKATSLPSEALPTPAK